MFPTSKLISAVAFLAFLTAAEAKTDAVLYRQSSCKGDNAAINDLATIGKCVTLTTSGSALSWFSMQLFTNGETQCFNWYGDERCQSWIVETRQKSNDCVSFLASFDASSVLRVPC